jgi:hypothetical protein
MFFIVVELARQVKGSFDSPVWPRRSLPTFKYLKCAFVPQMRLPGSNPAGLSAGPPDPTRPVLASLPAPAQSSGL